MRSAFTPAAGGGELLRIFRAGPKISNASISGKAPGHFKMKPGTQKALRDQMRAWIAKNLLLAFTFSGVSLGVILGICLRLEKEYKYNIPKAHLLSLINRPHNLDPLTIVYISYPGELFMRLLKLMILPLIIASLITGESFLSFSSRF